MIPKAAMHGAFHEWAMMPDSAPDEYDPPAK